VSKLFEYTSNCTFVLSVTFGLRKHAYLYVWSYPTTRPGSRSFTALALACQLSAGFSPAVLVALMPKSLVSDEERNMW
jgi:hypothetical protein